MSSLPKSLQLYFPEYSLDDLDTDRDRDLVIERTLEYGTRRELRWLFKTYGKDQIRNTVRRRGFRKLSKRAFHFWCFILGIKNFEKPRWLKKQSPLWPY